MKTRPYYVCSRKDCLMPGVVKHADEVFCVPCYRAVLA